MQNLTAVVSLLKVMLYQFINSFSVTIAYLDMNSYHKQDQKYLHCCNLDYRRNNLLVKGYLMQQNDHSLHCFLISFRDFKMPTILRTDNIGKPEKCIFQK